MLVAVVDRIPFNSSPRPQNPQFDALEGVSVAYLDSDAAAPDLWSQRNVSTERDTMTIQQRCSISFNIQGIGSSQEVKKIQLPVANTLFLNGKTSTLVAQRWIQYPNEAVKGRSFEMLQQQSLPEQAINIRPVPPVGFSTKQVLLHHLKRITRPQTVVASVGNIVQRVHPHNSLEASPASQELEKAIHQGIRDGGIPRHSPDVWALISPKGMPTPPMVARKFLEQGHRLHKVLSGGGGWGVKQGLLSLDPEVRYKTSLEEFEDKLLPVFQNKENGDKQLFVNTVHPGDTITFYVNRVPSGPTSAAESPKKRLSSSGWRKRHYLHFGTVPSSMDATRAEVEIGANTDAMTEILTVRDFFGALSEQGMSLAVGIPWPPIGKAQVNVMLTAKGI